MATLFSAKEMSGKLIDGMLLETMNAGQIDCQSRFQTVVFDLDGTLIDSGECAVRATQEAFSAQGFPIPKRADVLQLMGLPIEQSFPIWCGTNCDSERLGRLIERFRILYAEHSGGSLLKAFDGIVELLAALVGINVKSLIATSKKAAVARANCEKLGIAEYISGIIGSDSVVRYKPHPESLLRAVQLAGESDFSKILMVGDSTFDMAMGRAAGVSTCGVTWGVHTMEQLAKEEPTFIVGTVSQLGDVIYGSKSCSVL